MVRISVYAVRGDPLVYRAGSMLSSKISGQSSRYRLRRVSFKFSHQ